MHEILRIIRKKSIMSSVVFEIQQFQIWGLSILKMQIGEILSECRSQIDKIRKVSKQFFQNTENRKPPLIAISSLPALWKSSKPSFIPWYFKCPQHENHEIIPTFKNHVTKQRS